MNYLIAEIDRLKMELIEKNNKKYDKSIPLFKSIMKNEGSLKSLEAQARLQKEKEKNTINALKELSKQAESLEISALKDDHITAKEVLERKTDIKNKQKHIMSVEKLMENVTNSLLTGKHNTLEIQKSMQEANRAITDKLRINKEYITIFEEVKIAGRKLMEKKLEKLKIKDLKGVMNKLQSQGANLTVNIYCNFSKICLKITKQLIQSRSQ